MKKLLLLLLCIAGLSLSVHTVFAEDYSPHYLPGGKNYLSNDNFELSTGRYSTIDPFTIKAHTYYALSFNRDYFDPGQITWTMSFYENSTLIGTYTYDMTDMYCYSYAPYVAEYVFLTPANANYVTLSFDENNDYFLTNGITGFQLEEGQISTPYEPFVIGNLIDINGPVYQGSGVVIVNVDDPVLLSEITSSIVALDAIDGNVSANVTVLSDGYTANMSTLGEYVVQYSVEDQSDNVTTFDILVKVVDITDPIISGTNEIILPYPNTLSIAAIQSQLFASDNVDGEITGNIALKSDDYTLNNAVLGFYEVVFTVSDSSGNSSDYLVEVYVVDQADPIFSGPSSFTIGYGSSLSIDDILLSQTVEDDYDHDLTAEIVIFSDNYTPNVRQLGMYPVVFKVTDSSGNTAEKTIIVEIVDEIGPVIYLDTSIIMVYDTTILGLSDFTNLLIKTGELDDNTRYLVNVRFDSYTSRAAQEGVYHVALDFNNEAGITELSKTFQIVVKAHPADYIHELPDIDLDGEQSEQIFILKYWQYFAGGAVFILGIISNVIWFVMYKKR